MYDVYDQRSFCATSTFRFFCSNILRQSLEVRDFFRAIIQQEKFYQDSQSGP